MAKYTWHAIEGEFRLQVDIGGLRTDLVPDTGFTSSGCSTGLYVSEELVGTCFFHRMAAGILIWDFADQTLTIDINDG